MATVKPEQNEVDIYRDTYVRYLGYANELGESFRAFISKAAVRLTYVVAFGYGFADAVDKSRKQRAESISQGDSASQQNFKTASGFVQTLYWQSFASVIIPGFTINRTVALTTTIMQKVTNSPAARRWVPTAVGLGIIPVIIHPIDSLVNKTMPYIQSASNWLEKQVIEDH